MSLILGRRWVFASWLQIGHSALKIGAVLAVGTVGTVAFLKSPVSGATASTFRSIRAELDALVHPRVASTPAVKDGTGTGGTTAVAGLPTPPASAADANEKTAAPPPATLAEPKASRTHRVKRVAKRQAPADPRRLASDANQGWGVNWGGRLGSLFGNPGQ